MNLFIKISKEYINSYRKEFIECLKHNSFNQSIRLINVYTDEIDHNIVNIPKVKVIFKRGINSNNDLYRASKPNFSKMNIISEPFVKFNDLTSINESDLDEFIIKDKSYVIFSKDSKVDIKSNELIFLKKEKIKKIDTIHLRLIPIEIEVFKNKSDITIKKSKSSPRIQPTQRSKKLDVIIISVDYNDYLILTLEENSKIFDNITVVTSTSDTICQKICEKFGVRCVITDKMYEENAIFNKGKAINEGIKSIENPDLILLLDADIIVENKINLEVLSDDILYTSERIILPSYQSYQNYKNNKLKNKKIEPDKGYGFFQLFCINNKFINKENPFPETSNDASWSDINFRDKFEIRKRLGCVLHLGEAFLNWKGRRTDSFITEEQLNEKISETEILVNNVFDNIYCLNLEERKDRWNRVLNQFLELNINVQRWNAISGNQISDDLLQDYNPNGINGEKASEIGVVENKNAIGCLLSHIEIIKDAKLKGYKKILIFEDDVIIDKSINLKIKESLKINWKLLYLGASQFDWKGIETINGFYKSHKTLGTFAYAVDETIYDEIIEAFENNKKSIDNLLTLIQEKYNKECYTFSPNIVISDVEDSNIRKSNEMIEYSKKVKWDIESFNKVCNEKEKNFNSLVDENIIEIVNKSDKKSDKNTVLFLIYLNDTGGAEYVSYQHIKACKELEYNVKVMSVGKGMFFEKTKLLDIDLYHSKLNEINKSEVYDVLESLTDDVDIVYNCNYFGISEYMNKIKKNKKFKYYTIAHSDIEWVINEVYKHDIITDKYIVIHDKIRNELNKKGVCNTRISTVPNYVEFYKIQESHKNFDNRNLKRKLRILNNEFIIGMTTRISPDKNILDAIKILSKLDNNIKLLIVGDAPEKEEAKPYKIEVLDEIKKYNLEDRVIITGHVNNDDVIKYASCFNIAINTSPSEGLPISLLEQMSIGIHCIYPSHGEIPLVLSGCGSIIEIKQRKSFNQSSDDYIFNRFKDFEIDMFVNEIKYVLNKNTIDKSKIIERIKYQRSSESIKYYLDFLYGGHKEGISFVIRARNEILNIKDCIKSISDIADEIIFVDHLSTDGTYEKALELSKTYDNLKVFRYDREIPKPGPNYQNNINIVGNSIAQYYNFCLSKSTKKTIFKWDADFIANRENLNELITSYSLKTRDDKFSMWFTGETVFIKDEKKYINKDSFYDEYRGFSLSNGVKWEDAIRCEYVDRKYANSSNALRFENPCFYEIKRLNIDEFEHREGLIDERDRKDFQIIQSLKSNNIPIHLEEVKNLNKKVIITYGTFDTFHFGHIELIKRAKKIGDYLIVGVSTDSFNLLKNKVSRFNYEHRKEWIESIKHVDLVIPEDNWEQKINDIEKYNVDTFVMGDDWKGKFDYLPCNVVYLPRTENISSTEIKKIL